MKTIRTLFYNLVERFTTFFGIGAEEFGDDEYVTRHKLLTALDKYSEGIHICTAAQAEIENEGMKVVYFENAFTPSGDTNIHINQFTDLVKLAGLCEEAILFSDFEWGLDRETFGYAYFSYNGICVFSVISKAEYKDYTGEEIK